MKRTGEGRAKNEVEENEYEIKGTRHWCNGISVRSF